MPSKTEPEWVGLGSPLDEIEPVCVGCGDEREFGEFCGECVASNCTEVTDGFKMVYMGNRKFEIVKED